MVLWRARSLPVDWGLEFERDAPLKVELGFGNGDYLVRSAGLDAESNYLGIEMTWGSVWRALRTAEKAKLKNLRILLEDAKVALLWALQESSVDSFTGLFPCPWPKKRHAKHRLFTPSFLRLCNSRLRASGTLTVVTDAVDYREQMLTELTLAETGFELSSEVIEAAFDTKYERKWVAGGQDEFYRLTFHKVKHQNIGFPETVLVKHLLVANFEPQRFMPIDQDKPYKIVFKSFVYDPVRLIGMQEVLAQEDSIEQHFWIRIKQGREGWKIAPAAGSSLLPVPSVQNALDLVYAAAMV